MLTKLESLRVRKKNQGLRRAFQAASERWLGFEEAERWRVRFECDGERLRRRQRDGGTEAQKQSTQTKQTKK